MTYATNRRCPSAGRSALPASYTALLIFLLLAVPLAAPAVAQTRLLPNSTSNINFGRSVAIDGDYAVVGTNDEEAYIFFWDGDAWVRQVILTAPGIATSTRFGYSVAIDGDRVLVAAPGQAGDSRYGNGEAYVYTRTGNVWTQEAKLTASDGNAGDFFGGAIALDGDHVLIGALRDSESGTNAGAAYLFTYDGDSWSEQRLAPSVTNDNAYFGGSVSIAGDYAIVGASGDMYSIGGAAYIFDASLGWGQRTRLTDNNFSSSFGHAVAIEDHHGLALVGAPNYNSNTGRAYFYELSGTSWNLTYSTQGEAAGDKLGLTVALHNFSALVDTDLYYPWTLEPAQWTKQATVSVAQSTDDDGFGEAIAFDGANILVGASRTGTLGFNAGAAYVVEVGPQFTSSTNSVTLPDAPAGGTTNQTITITNTGLESLTVSDITNANPVFSASPAAFTLTPEESETVTITFAPSEVGLHEDELTFVHNGPGSPSTVAVSGTVRDAAPTFNSDPLVFTTTPPGDTTPRTLTVGNSGGVALEVTNITSTNDEVFSIATTAFNVPVGGNYALEVTFTPTAVGVYEGDLIFEHNGATSPDTLALSGQGRGAEISFSPDPLAFSTLAVDSTETRTITVSSVGLADLNVTSITSTTGVFSVATTAFNVPIGNTHELEVTFAPAVAGTFEDSLVFVHNGADSPDTLAVSGTARGAEISLQPSALAFPTTQLDSTAVHTLTVRSVGLADLDVTNITTLGDAFSVAETAFSVPMGEAYELDVLFTPTMDSTYADSLIITHNGITSPDTVAVSGTGRGAELVLEQHELEFPSAEVYESTSQTLVVRNVGISPLVVSNIEVIDPEHGTPLFTFSTDVDTFRVPPIGEYEEEYPEYPECQEYPDYPECQEYPEYPGTYHLSVTFTPDALGPHAAVLRITHNADTEPTIVPLTGEGAMPGVKLTTFREAAETSAPSFVTVAFQATDEYGRGLDFLDQTDLYDIQDGDLDVDEDEESIPSVEDFGSIPFTLKTVLMLDNSSSISNDLDDLKAAASAFVDQLLPQQEVALFTFSADIVLLEDFTNNADSLRDAIDGIRLGPNSTNLYGAVVEGASSYEEFFEITGQDARFEVGTIVLFSDGQDTQGSTPKTDALAAISDKQVITVAVGETAQSALPDLHTAPFDPIAVDNFGQLRDAFGQVQRELLRFSNSFYWLTYASPRQGNIERTLTVSLKENPYSGPGTSFTVTYNSNGFSPLNQGVYVNRSVKALGGVSTLEVVGGRDTLVTAEVLLVPNPPKLEWTPADPSLLTVTPLTSDGTEVTLRYHGEANTSTRVTVTDINNPDFLRSTRTLTVTAPTVTSTEETPVVPQASFLQPNYPNPFRDRTTFRYGLDRPQHVRLAIYDLTGRQVAVLVDATQAAGQYEAAWDARAVPSGVYFVRAVGESFVATQQVVLVR